MTPRIIHIEPLAPPKPAFAMPCNGCGVCCLGEPCPLGMVWSLRRQGPCRALHWDAASSTYRCGVLLRAGMWAGAGPLWRWLAAGLQHLVRRWIGAGAGCDCEWEVERRAPQAHAVASSPDTQSEQDTQNGSR